ncbi:MAG: MFS transporter [Hyphomicrobiales bacterium]|nr:MFS transporter [Hyphomicrobiales bacterium]
MAPPAARAHNWRTPLVVVVCGCLISLIGFGPRASFGLFLTPMSGARGWEREVFALSVAVQTLLYGLAQPFSGAIADRFGTGRVIVAGTLLYAAGVFMMAHATTPGSLYLSSGVLIGFGLSGCSFNLILSAFGKLLPEHWRSTAFGVGTASGSFGQFLFSPLGVLLIDVFGWQAALEVFAGLLLLMIPLAFAISTPRADGAGQTVAVATPSQNYRQALAEALRHRSYILLVLGFFTCGFQLAFVTMHLPAYLADRGLSAWIGGWTLGIIGLFNIFGAMASGWLGGRMPKRYLLSAIYFGRALAVVMLITLPPSTTVTLLYGAVTGLLWLSSVPPTTGLVAVMFGTRWLSMLFGIAFLSHQVGGFLGVWLGGLLFVQTGSYDVVWWLGVLFGVLSALVNLPIDEKPVPRLAVSRV